MSMRRVKALQRALVRAERVERSALRRADREALELMIVGVDESEAARRAEARYNRAYQWLVRARLQAYDAWMALAIAPTTIGLSPRECAYLEAWTERRVAAVEAAIEAGDTCTCGD